MEDHKAIWATLGGALLAIGAALMSVLVAAARSESSLWCDPWFWVVFAVSVVLLLFAVGIFVVLLYVGPRRAKSEVGRKEANDMNVLLRRDYERIQAERKQRSAEVSVVLVNKPSVLSAIEGVQGQIYHLAVTARTHLEQCRAKVDECLVLQDGHWQRPAEGYEQDTYEKPQYLKWSEGNRSLRDLDAGVRQRLDLCFALDGDDYWYLAPSEWGAEKDPRKYAFRLPPGTYRVQVRLESASSKQLRTIYVAIEYRDGALHLRNVGKMPELGEAA